MKALPREVEVPVSREDVRLRWEEPSIGAPDCVTGTKAPLPFHTPLSFSTLFHSLEFIENFLTS